MKILKSFRYAVFAAVMVVTTGILAVETDTYDVDPVHTFACFKVGHLGIGHVQGCFTDISGTVVVDPENPATGSADIMIKTASVNTFNEQRDAHLRNEDFFNVEKYQEMSFKSTAVEVVDENHYRVTGDFTLLGVTKPVTVDARLTGRGQDPWGNTRVGFYTEFSIVRSEYGMDKMIPAAGDHVDITLSLEGILRK